LFVYYSCNNKSVTPENFTLFVTTLLTENNVTNRVVMLRYPYLNLSVYGDGIDNYRTGKKHAVYVAVLCLIVTAMYSRLLVRLTGPV
jgi:hypothetical protein